MKKYNVVAVNIADTVNIKDLKSKFSGKLITSTNLELFYKVSENQYVTIFSDGVIAFANFSPEEMSATIDGMNDYIKDPKEHINESIEVHLTDSGKIYYEEDILYLPIELDSNDLIRIIMYDLSQTVAIDYYSAIAENMLSDVNRFASELEKRGRIKISKKEMHKFIGKSLTTRNDIVDNLYIFDTPDLVWEDDELEKVHRVLARTFNLNARFKELEYTFSVIDNNLQMFKEMYEHRRTTVLEIIVIILILIEVLKSLGEKLKFF